MKRRGVYWLSTEITENHHEKRKLLESRNYDVQFFNTLDSMIEKIRSNRVFIIVVGDEGPDIFVLEAIRKLSRMPEIHGARLILSTSRHDSGLLYAAACEGFRDALAVNLGDEEWGNRFDFSISGNRQELPSPVPQVTCKSEVEVSVPSRIVQISSDRLWLESRIAPDVGTELSLSGSIFESMGLGKVTITVEELSRNNLHFRFSEAIVASWRSEEKDAKQVFSEFSEIQKFKKEFQPKIFMAIQSPALRNSLLRHFENTNFDVRTALQKRTLVDGPKYFSPQILIIEERLVVGEHLRRFNTMAHNLSSTSTIVVIGSDDHKSALQGAALGRKLVFYKRIPKNFIESLSQYLKNSSNCDPKIEGKAYCIPHDHEYSYAGLSIPGRMVRIHPAMTRIAVPVPVGLFGMVRVDSSFLHKVIGRYPFSKVGAVKVDPKYRVKNYPYCYLLDCYFCDVDVDIRRRLGAVLAKSIKDDLSSGNIDTRGFIKKIEDNSKLTIENDVKEDGIEDEAAKVAIETKDECSSSSETGLNEREDSEETTKVDLEAKDENSPYFETDAKEIGDLGEDTKIDLDTSDKESIPFKAEAREGEVIQEVVRDTEQSISNEDKKERESSSVSNNQLKTAEVAEGRSDYSMDNKADQKAGSDLANDIKDSNEHSFTDQCEDVSILKLVKNEYREESRNNNKDDKPQPSNINQSENYHMNSKEINFSKGLEIVSDDGLDEIPIHEEIGEGRTGSGPVSGNIFFKEAAMKRIKNFLIFFIICIFISIIVFTSMTIESEEVVYSEYESDKS